MSTAVSQSTNPQSSEPEHRLKTADGLVDRTAPGFSAAVDLLSSKQTQTQFIDTQEAEVEYRNCNGDVLRRDRAVMERRPEDICGVLPYFLRNGQLYIVASESLWPAMLARRLRGLPMPSNCVGARSVAEIGGYLGNFDGLDQEACEIMLRKAGLKPAGPVQFLGNVQLPNAGVSGELGVPTAICIADPGLREWVIEGSDFQASRVAKVFSAQEIVNKFLDGTLADPRLFDDVLSLYERLRWSGESVQALMFPDELKAALEPLLAQRSEKTGADHIPIADSAEVQKKMTERPTNPELISEASVGKLGPVTPGGLYEPYVLQVQNRDSRGNPVGDPYSVDAVVRSSDVMNVIVLARVGDQIGMLLNQGSRPALDIRNQNPHLLHAITRDRNLEGVTGPLTLSDSQAEWAPDAVRQLVEKTIGCPVIGKPIVTRIQGVLSPGANPTLSRVAVVIVDLNSVDTNHLPPRFFVADPRAVLDANVKDLSLRVAARVAIGALSRSDVIDSPFTPREWEGYQRLMASTSAVRRFIREKSLAALALIRHDVVLSSLITRRLNDKGLQIEYPDKKDPERDFFNSLMQIFMVHVGDSPLKILQLLLHDCWHHQYRDVLPFRMVNGRLVVVEEGEYRHNVLVNEGDALMFSDVIVPQRFGIKKFEEESKEPSLAGLFADCGITSQREQREVIAQALEHGILPRSILTKLSAADYFARYESLIREKLLGYHVRDAKRNVQVLYKAWTSMPDVALLAHRMGQPLMASPGSPATDFHEKLIALESSVTKSTEHAGHNQLQEALGSMATYHFYLPALRLQYLRSAIDSTAFPFSVEQIDTLINRLVDGKIKVRELQSQITGIEEAEAQAAAYRYLVGDGKRLADDAAACLNRVLTDEDLVPEEARRFIRDYRWSPFPTLQFDPRDRPQDQTQVTELLLREFKRESLQPPAGLQ